MMISADDIKTELGDSDEEVEGASYPAMLAVIKMEPREQEVADETIHARKPGEDKWETSGTDHGATNCTAFEFCEVKTEPVEETEDEALLQDTQNDKQTSDCDVFEFCDVTNGPASSRKSAEGSIETIHVTHPNEGDVDAVCLNKKPAVKSIASRITKATTTQLVKEQQDCLNKLFTCVICERKFDELIDLSQHMEKHMDEFSRDESKKFHCNTCDYKCGLKRAILCHLREHNGFPKIRFSVNKPIPALSKSMKKRLNKILSS